VAAGVVCSVPKAELTMCSLLGPREEKSLPRVSCLPKEEKTLPCVRCLPREEKTLPHVSCLPPVRYTGDSEPEFRLFRT